MAPFSALPYTAKLPIFLAFAMPFRPVRALIALTAACLVFSGCGRPPAESVGAAVAAETGGIATAGKGAGFAWSIRFPALRPQWQALDTAIHDYADASKREFLQASAANDRVKDLEYSLDMTFSVARRTADFVSVTATGSSFTGGAHGTPIVASFNLDLNGNKLVTLGDLFGDPATAFKALSDECRRQLEGRYAAKMRDDPDGMTPAQLAADAESTKKWVDEGTAPTPESFGTFLIDCLDNKAIGVTVIFPPYQVAPYADGTQQVEVPAKVFYDLLKPEYKDAFAIDTQARQLGAGVR